MLPWNERPSEVAHLFNPAFCSVIVYEALDGYETTSGRGMPYPLVFLVLPIVLHKATRSALPRSISTLMHVWLQSNPEVRIRFADRARALVPITKEAILFSVQNQIVSFSEEGDIHSKGDFKAPRWSRDTEIGECVRRARFVGRWLANAGSLSTVYMIWGVRV